MRTAFLVTLVLAAPSFGIQEPEPQPLNVCVVARTGIQEVPKSEKKALENELKNKKKQAEQARKDLDKQFKKQYGKKREDWPPEQQEEYRRAKDAESMARFDLDSLKNGASAKGIQEAIDDSVEDIKKGCEGRSVFSKKGLIRLVEARDQAHLVVEVIDRWSGRVAVRLSPGEALGSTQQLSEISPRRRMMRGRDVLHTFREDEPYWVIQCSGQNWSDAANEIAGTINDFIKDNQAVLLGEKPR